MKKINLWMVVLFAAVLACPLVSHADEKKMEGSMMGKGSMSSMYPQMMEQRKEMMNDMMGMMKETMGILKDLNHAPTADQKKKLTEMITKLDDMTKKHDAMHEDMMKKMKERKGKE